MNLNDTLRGLLDGALAGNLTDEDRRRLTVLWVVAKALPEESVGSHLAAADWVLDLADAEEEVEDVEAYRADHTPRHLIEVHNWLTLNRTDTYRVQRVCTEARRMLAGHLRADRWQPLTDALDAVEHVFPTAPGTGDADERFVDLRDLGEVRP